MLQRMARSTLFPYTTLFRSGVGSGEWDVSVPWRKSSSGVPPLSPLPTPGHAFPAPIGAAASDRKSTRLNSSHVSISYAVFCLKKKKKSNKPCLDGENLHERH